MTSSSLRTRCLCLLLFLLHACCVVSKASASTRRRRNKGKDSHTTGIYFVLTVLSLCFIPAIIFFLYKVYQDPLTPTLVSNGSQYIAERTTGYLSARTSKKTS